MNDHANTSNIVVDSSTNSIKNIFCISLDNILQLLLLRKNSLPNLKPVEGDKSLHFLTINQNLESLSQQVE